MLQTRECIHYVHTLLFYRLQNVFIMRTLCYVTDFRMYSLCAHFVMLQTPDDWELDTNSLDRKKKSSHKRSASVGNGDSRKEVSVMTSNVCNKIRSLGKL